MDEHGRIMDAQREAGRLLIAMISRQKDAAYQKLVEGMSTPMSRTFVDIYGNRRWTGWYK